MGDRLVAYFARAEAKGGIQAKLKLAMLTKMSSAQAQGADDSAENIKKFEDSLAQL
jgi:hypothetical protein